MPNLTQLVQYFFFFLRWIQFFTKHTFAVQPSESNIINVSERGDRNGDAAAARGQYNACGRRHCFSRRWLIPVVCSPENCKMQRTDILRRRGGGLPAWAYKKNSRTAGGQIQELVWSWCCKCNFFQWFFFANHCNQVNETGGNITHRIDLSDEVPLCASRESVVYPKQAQNKEEKWLFIVNQDKYLQGVRVEICTWVCCNLAWNTRIKSLL